MATCQAGDASFLEEAVDIGPEERVSPEVYSPCSEMGVRSAGGCTPGAMENFGLERVTSLEGQLRSSVPVD